MYLFQEPLGKSGANENHFQIVSKGGSASDGEAIYISAGKLTLPFPFLCKRSSNWIRPLKESQASGAGSVSLSRN